MSDKTTYQIDLSKANHIHFIGIGGISMSGLAEVLLDRGFAVSGSDKTPSPLTRQLEEKGASISYPQSADNLTGSEDAVVYTAAIHPDNPELKRAQECSIPLLTRAQLLGQIMDHYPRSIAVAGTHGKTTTSSMLGQILLCGEEDPTLSIGGIFPAIGSNIHVGSSDIFLTEACEYSNSFFEFRAKYSVILNVEAEHLDFFKDLDDIIHSFRHFAENTSADGALIIHEGTSGFQAITEGLPCKVYTFGLSDSSDFFAADIQYNEQGCGSFTCCRRTADGQAEALGQIRLSVPGEHNVSNAIAAIAVCDCMGLPFTQIAKGLADFGGTKRRFEHKGTYHGATVVDDYSHHPTEIRAALSAAAKIPKNRLVVVFQPHTYTRTKAFLEDFADALSAADLVILPDIYAAREDDIYGISSRDLQQKIQEKGTECAYIPEFEKIVQFLQKELLHDDLLITMGAGNVFTVGEQLLAKS